LEDAFRKGQHNYDESFSKFEQWFNENFENNGHN
jgi:hypothetical protein